MRKALVIKGTERMVIAKFACIFTNWVASETDDDDDYNDDEDD